MDRDLSGKVKLESLEGPESKKRKVYDELSEPDGPLSQEDVKYFRKQAIWRQMKYYKMRAKDVDSAINDSNKKLQDLQHQLDDLKAWRSKICRLVNGSVADDEELIGAINTVIDRKLTDEELKAKFSKLNEYIDEISHLETENEGLKTSKIELEIKLDELSHKLVKQSERSISELVQRVYNGPNDKEVKPESNGSQTPNGAASEVSESSEEVKEMNRIIQELTQKLHDVSQEKEKLGEEMKVPVEIIKLQSAIGSNVLVLEEQLIEKEQAIKQLNNRINNYNELTTNELSKQLQTVKDTLKKTETDLMRIRNVRDDLLNKVNMLEKQKTNEELIKINDELTRQINYQQKTNGDATSEEIIRELEDGYKKLVGEIHVKILNQIEQETLIKKYQIEKTKADQKYFQIMKLKDTLTNENKLLKFASNKSNEVIDKFQEVESKYKEKINKLQEIIDELNHQISSFKSSKKKLVEENNHKLIEINKLVQKLGEISNQMKTAKQEKIHISNKLNEAEVEIIKLKKYKNQVNSNTPLDNDELNGFRSMVKCSVCSKNWKDTVITVCGHVFCNQCTKERLNARLRRCPSCNKGFSGNDLLGIHL